MKPPAWWELGVFPAGGDAWASAGKCSVTPATSEGIRSHPHGFFLKQAAEQSRQDRPGGEGISLPLGTQKWTLASLNTGVPVGLGSLWCDASAPCNCQRII